jgi:hypothetical protein
MNVADSASCGWGTGVEERLDPSLDALDSTQAVMRRTFELRTDAVQRHAGWHGVTAAPCPTTAMLMPLYATVLPVNV